MELGEYLATLRKGWLVITLLAVLGGALGYAQAAQATPMYRSSSTVYLSLARGETVSELNQGATYAQNLVESFVQLATMPAVLEPVIEDLGLDVTPRALAGSVQADSPLNTMLIEISAVSADPARAAAVANGVAASLADTVVELSPTTTEGAASLRMTVVAEAQAAAAPFSPQPRRDAAAGIAAGLVLGVLVALLRAQLDTRVRTVQDLPGAPARVALGQVPLDRTLVKHPRTVLHNLHSPLAEAYRRLAANLQFLDASRPLRTIVVSSSAPGEGKSTTAVNLAIVMAEKRGRVLLVDADLRSPSIATICGLEGAVGLSTVLGAQASLEDVVQEWGVPGLHVITAGQIPPNPSQLIDSVATDDFLALASATYDLVILDTPPLLALTDGAVLARKTDGAVVVARSRKVSRPHLVEALTSLDALGATCLGLLLNGVPTPRSELRYGYGTPGRRWSRQRRAHGRTRQVPGGDVAPAPSPQPAPRRRDDAVVPTTPVVFTPEVAEHHEHVAAPAVQPVAPLAPAETAPLVQLEPAPPAQPEPAPVALEPAPPAQPEAAPLPLEPATGQLDAVPADATPVPPRTDAAETSRAHVHVAALSHGAGASTSSRVPEEG